tara:strand:+ start:9624 stop:9959 length:336 start_codon:yes stop_codon:yes gene_type:complete
VTIQEVIDNMSKAKWHIIDLYGDYRIKYHDYLNQIRTSRMYPDGESRWVCPVIYKASLDDVWFKPFEIEKARQYLDISKTDLILIIAAADGNTGVFFNEKLRHEMIQNVKE